MLSTNRKEFGAVVRDRRMKEDLSQEELAQNVGISRVYLSQIERGVAENVSVAIYEKLATYLGITLSQSSPTPTNLPPALVKLQEEHSLPDADVRMLASLQFRGKKPATTEQWLLLYKLIQATSESWGE